MARLLLFGGPMTPSTSSHRFAVRKLTQSGPYVYEVVFNRKNSVERGASLAGAVHEVECEELRLSSEEVAQRLDTQQLRSTDLVMIDGTWTTIAESFQFEDVAAPHARRERRERNTRSALIFLAVVVPQAVILATPWLYAFFG